MTVQQFINAAFQDIGVLAQGESPSSDESNDALTRLNQLLQSWGLQGLTTYKQNHTSHPLSIATPTYTMGSGGAFNTAWPVKIVSAAAVQGNFRNPVKVLSFEELRDQSKDDTGRTDDLPSLLGVDNGHPLKTLRLFPTPRSSSTSLELDWWEVFTAFAALGDTVSLAPGYELALQHELSLILAPSYGRGITKELAAAAQMSKGTVQEIARSIHHPPVPVQPAA